jgi:hypothetical protein
MLGDDRITLKLEKETCTGSAAYILVHSEAWRRSSICVCSENYSTLTSILLSWIPLVTYLMSCNPFFLTEEARSKVAVGKGVLLESFFPLNRDMGVRVFFLFRCCMSVYHVYLYIMSWHKTYR